MIGSLVYFIAYLQSQHAFSFVTWVIIPFVYVAYILKQGLPTYPWPCTPSAFRQMCMHYWNFLWQKGWAK